MEKQVPHVLLLWKPKTELLHTQFFTSVGVSLNTLNVTHVTLEQCNSGTKPTQRS